jgi:hypothetical protein
MWPGLQQVLRFASLRAPVVACVSAGITFAHVPVLADEASIALPIYNVPIATHAGATAERVSVANPETSARMIDAPPAFELRRATPRFAMVELPPDAALPGSGYKRPHHAIGYRWQVAESWLRDHGIEAQTCYLPMVRLHSKVAASGVSGTLWVYGRCTFK